MKSEREKSNITVSIVDLSAPLAQATEAYNEDGHKATTMSIRGTSLGYVQTHAGLFCLCTEGVGDSKPITEDNPAEVELYPEYAGGSGMMPAGNLKLTDTELIMLPVKDERPLEEFIRSFGSRLEGNYRDWLHALRKAKPMVMEEHG